MINKKISLLCILLLSLLILPDSGAQNYPKQSGYVNDFAGVMSARVVGELESFLNGFTKKTGVEIAVAVVKDMGGLDVDTYAVELFKEWGVGSKELNDGLLILVAVNERRQRIEVGYGLEHIITDVRAGQIRNQYMTPYLKDDDYSSGVARGVLAAVSVIAGEMGVSLDGATTVPAAPQSGRRRSGNPMSSLIKIIVFIIIFLLLGGRRGGRGLLTGMLLGSMLGGGRGRYYGGSGFGGGFGGGGGGGFSGFGGGFSGGGGASGGF